MVPTYIDYKSSLSQYQVISTNSLISTNRINTVNSNQQTETPHPKLHSISNQHTQHRRHTQQTVFYQHSQHTISTQHVHIIPSNPEQQYRLLQTYRTKLLPSTHLYLSEPLAYRALIIFFSFCFTTPLNTTYFTSLKKQRAKKTKNKKNQNNHSGKS